MRVRKSTSDKKLGDNTWEHVILGYHGHAVLGQCCGVLAEREDMHMLLVHTLTRKMAFTQS